jgi:PKD repeat protein
MGTSTAENPSYAYSNYGTFTVTLTVTNPYGVDTVMHTVEVVTEPMCDFTAEPNPAGVNEPVQFTNLTEGTEPITYTWTFGDGTSSMAENPTHAYTAVGTYTVELEAVNVWGSSSCTTTVVVEGLLPTADFDSTCPDIVGETTHFTNTSTGSMPFTSFLWTFGDGSAPSFDENPSHTYANTGAYTVTLQIANDYGGDTVEKVCVIQEECEPLTDVSFSYDPVPARSGQTIHFTASYTPMTATTPIDVSWDFGDGGMASGLEVTHVFTATGSYSVTVTAENCDGAGFASFTQTVDVAEGDFLLYLPMVFRNY